MKRGIIFILVLFVLPFVSSDVISVNSGGDSQLCVNSGNLLEDCFFGEAACVPTTCSILGYECDSWSDGCGGTLSCGSCPSGYSCSSGTCVITPTGGGGGTGGGYPSYSITLSPTEFNVYLAVNTTKQETVAITNYGTTNLNLTFSQLNLGNHIIFDQRYVYIPAGQTVNANVIFVALSEPGIFTGKILIGGKEILVTLNVQTELLLFDSNIIVLNKDYKVPQGDELKTQVTLLPLGDKARLDVTLNYEIKDYTGRTYLTRSETLLVEDEVDFKRNFDTGSLPIGKYVVGLELVYPNGVAPSSAHFEVTEPRGVSLLGKIVLFLVISILIVGILIVIVYIRRRIERKR